jgi:hypothetical protein
MHSKGPSISVMSEDHHGHKKGSTKELWKPSHWTEKVIDKGLSRTVDLSL